MPNFVDCWGALKSKGYKHADGSEVLDDNDKASIMSRIQEHLKTGLDPLEAARASVQSHLDETHGQLQSIYEQTGAIPKPVAPVSEEGQPSTVSTLPAQKGEVTGAVSGTESPPAPAPPTSTEPHVSGIANRISEEKAKRGEIGEVAPGQGQSVTELRQRGLKMNPEEVNQHVSDVMAGTGDIVKQGEALTAEEARLSQRSNQLSKEAEADPTNTEKKLAADTAFKDLTDFHNGPIATLKTRWSDAGRTLQGEIPVDLSTFNGMREAWLKDTGKAPLPEVEPVLRDAAQKVAKSNGEADASVAKVGQSIDQATRGLKLPSYEQVRENILQRLKERAPCN
jgi:hypothetical protein